MFAEPRFPNIIPAGEPGDELVVDAGLELAIAMYDAFLADCGPDLAVQVRRAFEARIARRRRAGGEEARAADATAATFADFDWHRRGIVPASE